MKKLIVVTFSSMILIGCSGQSLLVYEPSSTKEISTFFSNGIPIGTFSSDDEFILFSVDETSLFGRPYLRVWLLYENISDSPFLLEPYEFIKLEAEIDGELFSFYEAESPSKILSAIDEEETIATIFNSIGGALESLTVEGTTITSNTGEVYKINDENEKRKTIIQQNKKELQNTLAFYDLFKKSFSSGVLRKNTVFPEQSVNGYLYFPLENVKASDSWANFYIDISDLNFYLLIINKSGTKRVELAPTSIW